MCKIRGYESFEVVKKQALLIVVKVDLRFTTIAKLWSMNTTIVSDEVIVDGSTFLEVLSDHYVKKLRK